MAIPSDQEVSVIAAIGPLNSRMEVNSHSHTPSDHNVDDIRINFAAKVSLTVWTNIFNCLSHAITFSILYLNKCKTRTITRVKLLSIA